MELTINDLQTLRVIVDIAASRGAFKASEFETVGAVYNRLVKFLDEAAQKAG